MAKTTHTATRRRRRQAPFAATPDGYLAYKRQPGAHLAESTTAKYAPEIRAFDRYCRDNGIPLAEQGVVDIEDWFFASNVMFAERYKRQPSDSYARNRYSALKSYFEFLKHFEHVDDNPLDRITPPRADHGEVDWLTEEEDEAMAGVDKEPLEEILWALTRVAGLRISEVPYLLDADVDVALGEIHVREGKTPAATRDIQILPRLYTAIARWRAYRDETYGKPLPGASFVRTARPRNDETDDRPRHISTVYIDRIIKRVATRAGVRLHRDKKGNPIPVDKAGHNTSAVSAHVLRRTYGSDLLNRGVSIEVVSEQLGHANIRITQEAYARLLKRTVRREVLCAIDGGVTSAKAASRAAQPKKSAAKDISKSRAQRLRELEALETAIQAQKQALMAA